MAVTGNGAVLVDLDIPYTVDITGANVTVQNVDIHLTGDTFGIAIRHSKNVTIEDSRITGGLDSDRLLVGIKDIYGDSSGIVIARSDISGTSTAIQIYGGLIEDNYLHDLGKTADDHVNGTTSNGSTTPLIIRRNTIFNQYPQTDAISLFQDFGVEANRLIEGNLLGGGAYTLYGGANPGGEPTTNIRILGNRFTKKFFPAGGAYGPVTAFDVNGTGNRWLANIWDHDGSPVPSP